VSPQTVAVPGAHCVRPPGTQSLLHHSKQCQRKGISRRNELGYKHQHNPVVARETTVPPRFVNAVALIAIAFGVAAPARSITVTIGGPDDINIATDVRDATIYENAPDNSNGGGPGMYAGTDGTSLPLRGLIGFDIADNVPAGARIIGVQLEMYLGKFAGSGGAGSGQPFSTIGLHKMSADWREGTNGQGSSSISSTGQGFPANSLDTTWYAASYPDTLWNNPGGDFTAAASAVTTVGTTLNALSTWGSTPAMVADAQAWLDDPTSNFGWSVVNLDETSIRTFRAFWTKEAGDATLRPALLVTYNAIPGDVNDDGVVNGLDISLIAGHWLQTGASVLGDANGDGVVNGLDIGLISSNWLQHAPGGGGASAASVPEPSTGVLGTAAMLVLFARTRPRHRSAMLSMRSTSAGES